MKNWLQLALFALLPIPGLYLRLAQADAGPLADSIIFGLGILGAAFLLSWAVEVAEMDMARSLAVAFLALIAVLPEYSVDLYFAWSAAYNPEHAAYAAANMTGANRMLVGLAWPLMVFLFWLRHRRYGVLRLDRGSAVELSFLLAATLYSFIIPIKGTFSLLDSVILISLFGLYVWVSSHGKKEEHEQIGLTAIICSFSKPRRRAVVAAMFLYSALVILAAAQPFADGLVALGKSWAIDDFILVQWVAPLASEAPEIVIAGLLVLRGRVQSGMGTLISSKVNQWTLLVGSLPVAYSISSGFPASLVLDARQTEEVLLTAAQSFLAIILLARLRLTPTGAVALFLLFALQLFLPSMEARWVFSGAYLFLAASLLLIDRRRFKMLLVILPQVVRSMRRKTA